MKKVEAIEILARAIISLSKKKKFDEKEVQKVADYFKRITKKK